MKKANIAKVIVAGMLLTGASAYAADNAGSHNPAVKDSTAHATPSAAKGANSFTEDQARGRLGKAGYTQISDLKKDDNGVWTGTAMKGGTKTTIGLDYKGNITKR